MSRVRVAILTTAGPVSVQRITEEDPDVDSVVCLAGKAVALPISPAYNAFVREPTGVIQRAFGGAAYRVDLSAPVTEGYSWQLALYAAHALAAAGRLAGPDDAADVLVLVTGEVDRDLKVSAVDHVAEKVRAAEGVLAEAREAGLPVIVALPAANPASSPEGCRFVATETVDDLLRTVGLGGQGSPVHGSTDPGGESGGRRLFMVGGVAVVVLATALAGFWYTRAREPIVPTPVAAPASPAPAPAESRNLGPADITIELIEHRPPRGSTCAALLIGSAEAVPVPVPREADGRFKPSNGEGLCRLEVRARAAEGITLSISNIVWTESRRGARAPSETPPPSAEPDCGAIAMILPLPRRLALPATLSLVVEGCPATMESVATKAEGQPKPSESCRDVPVTHRVVRTGPTP